MVVTPSHPAPGAVLQVNKMSSSRRVGVLDALMGDTHDASAGNSNSVYFGRRLVAHVAEGPLKPVSHSTHGYTGRNKPTIVTQSKSTHCFLERFPTVRM